MGDGGGDTDIKYTSSKEQRAMSKALLPLFQGFGQYGQERFFGGAPNLGAPSMSGVLTGQPMYDIPDPSTAMPTNDWWGSLNPGVKQGLYAPYKEAGEGLMSAMGGRGQLGSERGGFSGAAGAAMGELAGQAANNMGLAAWNMTAPMAMNAWNADLNRNMTGWQQGQQEAMGNYNTAYNAWQMPMQAMGGLGMAMPQAYTNPTSGGFGSAMSGAAMGGLSGYGMSGGNPYVTGGGALLGGLGGYFS